MTSMLKVKLGGKYWYQQEINGEKILTPVPYIDLVKEELKNMINDILDRDYWRQYFNIIDFDENNIEIQFVNDKFWEEMKNKYNITGLKKVHKDDIKDMTNVYSKENMWVTGTDSKRYVYDIKINIQKEVTVLIELPGVSKDSIKVEKSLSNVLYVTATDYDYIDNKVTSKTKTLSLTLPLLNFRYSNNPEDITAQYIDGMLICKFKLIPKDYEGSKIKVNVT